LSWRCGYQSLIVVWEEDGKGRAKRRMTDYVRLKLSSSEAEVLAKKIARERGFKRYGWVLYHLVASSGGVTE